MIKDAQKGTFFYGWWIVAASCLIMSLNGGLYFYGFSSYFMPLIEEFRWSRAALAGVFSMARLEGGLLGPVEGFLVDKFGPRKIMFAGILIMGIGFILMSQINSFIMFCMVFVGLIAVGHSLGAWMPIVVAIVNWFRRKRSRALGLAQAGMGIGGLMLIGLAWFIARYGWRDAALTSGIAIIAISIPISLVMRHRPEQYGYLPDGDTAAGSDSLGVVEEAKAFPQWRAKMGEEPEVAEVDFTLGEALKTHAFWLLAAALIILLRLTFCSSG